MNAPEGFTAARSDVLLVLKKAEITRLSNWYLTFSGTEAELLTARVASPEMFTGFGKTGVKTSNDGNGDQYVIRRRAKGRFELELLLFQEPRYADPSDPRVRESVGWKTYGPECETIVSLAMQRMRAPKAAQS